MAKGKLKFNNRAIAKLMEDPQVVADLEKRAAAVRDACNSQSTWGGYYSAVSTEGNRPRARVWSVGPKADEDNARNQRLIRNLQAGG